MSKLSAYWRRKRSGLILYSLLACFVIVTMTLCRRPIIRMLPAGALLPFVHTKPNAASYELDYRFFEGELSNNDMIVLFERKTALRLTAGQTVPLGCPVFVCGTFQHDWPVDCNLALRSWHASVDGVVVAGSTLPLQRFQNRQSLSPQIQEDWVYELPPLELGKHDIVISQKAAPAMGAAHGRTGAVVPSAVLTFESSIRVHVEKLRGGADKNLTTQLVAEMTQAFRARMNYSSKKFPWSLHLVADDSPIAFAGTLIIREPDTQLQVGERFVVFPKRERSNVSIYRTLPPEVATHATVDFFLIPDAGVAAAAQLDDYCSAIIAWEGIPLQEDGRRPKYSPILGMKPDCGPVVHPSRIIASDNDEYEDMIKKFRAIQ